MVEEKKESGEKREQKKEKAEGKGGKNNLKAAAAVIIVIAIVGILLYSISLFAPQNAQNPYQMVFGNETRNFRANLIEADRVPVYPSADAIKGVFLSGNVSNISMYYIDGNQNGAYGVSAIEFTIKMGTILKYYHGGEGYTYGDTNRENCLYFYADGTSVCFNIEALKNATDISGIISSASSPALVLLGPPFSTKTAVTISNYTVTAEGKSFDGKQYTDLDLAVDKILIELMKPGETKVSP